MLLKKAQRQRLAMGAEVLTADSYRVDEMEATVDMRQFLLLMF